MKPTKRELEIDAAHLRERIMKLHQLAESPLTSDPLLNKTGMYAFRVGQLQEAIRFLVLEAGLDPLPRPRMPEKL